MVLSGAVNPKQKGVVWIGALSIVAMGMYPPWIQVSVGMHRQYAYGWIFAPPVVMALPEKPPFMLNPLPPDQSALAHPPLVNPWAAKTPSKDVHPDPAWRTELDVTRLALQWVMLVVLMAAFYLAWPGPAIREAARSLYRR